MSIPVELEALAAEVERHGPFPYLLTVTDDGRPHAVSVGVGWDGDRLVMQVGRRTAGNAVARPAVSLLWAPHEPGGYTLIVDGTGEADGDRLAVRPGKAVLHRNAAAAQAEGGYAADCVPVETSPAP